MSRGLYALLDTAGNLGFVDASYPISFRGEERVILVWEADGLDREPTVIGSSQMKIRGVTFVKNDILGVTLWQPYDAGPSVKTFINKLMLTDLEGRDWRDPIDAQRAQELHQGQRACGFNTSQDGRRAFATEA